jgi:hypothetical protein
LIEQEKSMTRSVSTPIALLGALAVFSALAFMGCGGQQANSNSNTNSSLGTPAPAVTVDCNDPTSSHDKIMDTIYKAIGSKEKYAVQEWQFNITENNKQVKIVGWSPDYVDIANLVIATAVNCQVSYNGTFVPKAPDLDPNNRLIRACAPGYVPCGDICIPIGDFCRVTSDSPAGSPYTCTLTGTPNPSPSSSPAPTTKQSNKY